MNKLAVLVGALLLISANIVGARTDMASYKIHLANGLEHIKNKNFWYARKEFEFIIRHGEWDAIHRSIAQMNLGIISFMEENIDQAIQHYQTAIQLKSDYAEAYFNLGGAYYKQGDLKKAEETFSKAIELQPEYGRAHYSLATVYFDQKKYEAAQKHADKAKEYGVPYKTLAQKLAKVGKQ